jgi:hypothetical protein
MAKIKRSFIVSDEHLQKLNEIEGKYSLNHSDTVRRGIDAVHDFNAGTLL